MGKVKLCDCAGDFYIQRILYLLIFTCAIRSGLCSRITFQNGAYNNVLVAIHSNTDPANCVELVQNISDAFRIASTNLELATNGLSRFGTIQILIPPNWGSEHGACNIPSRNFTESPVYSSYENADFKIGTNHPFASKLPWTKQYKGCENESDSIFVPLDFLTTPNFDAAARGRILLHEWAKFRYGVFEEFGYYNDPIFSPCYSMGGKNWYTSCSDVQLEALQDSGTVPITDDECRLLLQQNSTIILDALRSATSSIMFGPHLANMINFCTNETQIGLAPTRHNVLCERKSVAEVVRSHPDFQQMRKVNSEADTDNIFPNTRGVRNRVPRIEPTITLIRKSVVKRQGLALLLEDDAAIREFGQLQHVKQAFAQILRLAPDQITIGIFSYDGLVLKKFVSVLGDDGSRVNALIRIPESNTLGLLDRYNVARSNRRLKDKLLSIQNVLQELTNYMDTNWEIIQVTSSPPVDIASTIAAVQATEHTLSILTFDQSKDWLQFNTIPNTNKVIHLPRCSGNDLACHGITSSLFVDHFAHISTMVPSMTRQFTHKVMDFTFDGGAMREFLVSQNSFVGNINKFYFFIPVYEENTVLSVISPSGVSCTGVALLGYSLVQTVNSSLCPYQMGTWKIQVSGSEAANSFRYTLQAYAETADTDHDLIISASYGRKLSAEIFPRMGGLPVYVSVSNALEQPVISASVELNILHENQNFSNFSKIRMLDNGMDPDLTSNDGIYSAYVTNYNSDPSFHTGQILVTTTAGTSRAIVTLGSSGDAAILEPNMASKCCGSSVPFQETTSIGNSAYSVVLPSFRTGEAIGPNDDILPPSRISRISILETSKTNMILGFSAPGSNYSTGTVSYYDICCTNSTSGSLEDSLCKSVDSKECLPVESGTVQSCNLFLRDVGSGFLNYSQTENSTSPEIHSLYCSLRGVDSSENSGPLSYTLFEVLIDSQIMAEGYGECNSVSDGCLPITVFWVLIGCAGFLMILLFVLLLCWFCSSRKKQKEITKASADSNSVRYIGGFPDESGHAALHNVYINQAYIQDSNGHLKLVASDGELLPFDSLENGRFPAEPGIRRRSVSEPDDVTRKHVSWNGGVDKDKDMPVYFSADKRGNHSSAVSLPQLETTSAMHKKQYSSSIPPRPSDDRASVPVQLRSTFRPGSETNTLNLPRIANSQSIPSISSTIEQQEAGPVYASVTRGGRKSSPYNSGAGYTPSFGSPVNPLGPSTGSVAAVPYSIASAPVSRPPPAMVLPPARTSVPVSVAAPTPKYIHNRPPIRMDHFPSSESEVYSDMSHILPNSSRPTSGVIPVSASPAHNFSRNMGTRQEIIGPLRKNEINGPIRNNEIHGPLRKSEIGGGAVRNNSPPKTLSGLGRRDGQSADMSRPPVFPPPPPPPRQSQPSLSTSPPRNQEDDEYDDDSDNWDNYEDFTFNNPGTGSSYA